MHKHSVMIFGHQTSFTLEPEFWAELKNLAEAEKITIGTLVERIDSGRSGHLSSAIRIYILNALKKKIVDNKQPECDTI